MNLLRIEGTLFLEHQDRKVPVESADLVYLARMTPFGRKVYFRNKARELLLANGNDPVAETLIEWYRLPARDWAFSLPEP